MYFTKVYLNLLVIIRYYHVHFTLQLISLSSDTIQTVIKTLQQLSWHSCSWNILKKTSAHYKVSEIISYAYKNTVSVCTIVIIYIYIYIYIYYIQYNINMHNCLYIYNYLYIYIYVYIYILLCMLVKVVKMPRL